MRDRLGSESGHEGGGVGGAWSVRVATPSDAGAVEGLIRRSVHGLQAGQYTEAQREAAIGPVFAVDHRLIADGTYYVAEVAGLGGIVGCGGWSRRKSLFGGGTAVGEEEFLDPGRDAARIRAFFVAPEWARRGVGRGLLGVCEEAIGRAGFRRVTLVATLTGEPFYRSFGYEVTERFEVGLEGGLRLPVVGMGKEFGVVGLG